MPQKPKMKILILLRYPKVEKSLWKKAIVDKLLAEGYEVSLLFGECSYWRHFRAALKEYGFGLFAKAKSEPPELQTSGVKLYGHFKNKLIIRKVDDLNSKHSEKIIRALNPDYLLLLGTGIIRKNILSIKESRVVHCHHGYLPDFRGVHMPEWALFHGKDVYITTHFINPGIDTGDIIRRKKIRVTRHDTLASVRQRGKEESVDLIVQTLNDLREGRIIAEKQSATEGRQYYRMHAFLKEMTNQKLQSLPVE